MAGAPIGPSRALSPSRWLSAPRRRPSVLKNGLVVISLLGCRGPVPSARESAAAPGALANAPIAAAWAVEPGPSVPEAVANNAVASLTVEGRPRLFSFMGLGPGKDFRAITRRAFVLDIGGGGWSALPDVPGPTGRIAATAQGLGRRIFIFGGYGVASDGKETTSAAVDIFDLAEGKYSRGADMPIPVDDAVSGVFRESLIYVVGGWSTSHNVDAVQIYDPARDQWKAASPLVGAPVFGHAGGLVRDVIVYCGGARIQSSGSPKYVANSECYRGDIDPTQPTRILWRRIASHPGPARYRAAAGPVDLPGLTGVMFAGGTSNPYNYNGVGYDQQPSEPESLAWIYDVLRDTWVEGPRFIAPTMDHRGLLAAANSWWTGGGMGTGQAVMASVTRIRPLS